MTQPIYILTGPIQSGKSQALRHWAKGKNVTGFLTPTVESKKVFLQLPAGATQAYELEGPSTDTIPVGRYYLNGAAFRMAMESYRQALITRPNLFVMDEIGKLELRGSGHHNLLRQALEDQHLPLLLVIRDSLLPAVVDRYQLEKYRQFLKQDLWRLSSPEVDGTDYH